MRFRLMGLVLVLLLAAGGPPPLLQAGAPAERAQPYTVTGIVVSVVRGLLTLQLEKGGTATFRLLENVGSGDAPVGGISAGMRVQVWVLLVPEGIPVVLRILPLRGLAPARPVAEARALRGVVLAQSGATLSVLGERNVLSTVVLTGTTVVRGGKIQPRAIVEVDGARNSDGSVSARAITVLFDPRAAARATGRIVQRWPEVGFVLADGTMVVVGDQTWIVRGTTLRSLGALAPGALVTVLGVAAPPFINARVIEVSL